MEGCAGVSDDVFGIDGFACRMLLGDVCSMFVEGFGEVVNSVFIQAGSGDKMHGTNVHACESFCLASIGICWNGGSKKEGIVFEEVLFGRFFKGNEVNVLRCAGLSDGGGGNCTA